MNCGRVNFTTRVRTFARVLNSTNVTVVAEALLELRVRVSAESAAFDAEGLSTSGLRTLRGLEALTDTDTDALAFVGEPLGVRRADAGVASTFGSRRWIPHPSVRALAEALVADCNTIRAVRVLGAGVGIALDQTVTRISVVANRLVDFFVGEGNVRPFGDALGVGDGLSARAIEAVITAQRIHRWDVSAVKGRNEERGHSV